jgi:hypothetical protein
MSSLPLYQVSSPSIIAPDEYNASSAGAPETYVSSVVQSLSEKYVFALDEALEFAGLPKVFNLQQFTYNNENINYNSIHAFNLSSRHDNDKNNKTREHIIGAIINNKVPENYYTLNEWLCMKINIFNYLKKLSDKPYIKVECINKAGRGNNYDFLFKLFYDDDSNQEFKVELKFNVSTIDDAPQFVSPMKPSKYMSSSYEDYYFDNYLQKLADKAHLKMPTKEEYMKQIHSMVPKCMKEYQDIYYNGCYKSSKFTNKEEDIKIYNFAKELANESIRSFITNTELNIDLLSSYLHTTQKNKIYMLYSNKEFVLQQINIDDYTIDRVVKNDNRYECISKNGKKINILLRWKNGHGIAFPAFQIQSKKSK